MQVTVTEHDLLNGVINSYTSDPIARAITRLGLSQVRVGREQISFIQGGERVFLPLHPNAKQFLKRLAYGDRHEMLKVKRNKKGDVVGSEPFTFPLVVNAQTEVAAA